MNCTYSIVYNAALGEYQVASEKTKTRRSKARKLLPIILAGLLVPTWAVDIVDSDPAINVSDHPTAQWADYIFKTINPIGPNGSEKFGFADWRSNFNAYMQDFNDSNKKSAWEASNRALKDNVANYFALGHGYLNINKDKTFQFKEYPVNSIQNLIKSNQLVAISVEENKKLNFKLDRLVDETERYDHRLFNIESGGTLTLNGGTEAALIVIDGFRVKGWISLSSDPNNAGAISNFGNTYFGNFMSFINNSSSFSPLIAGGAIANQGIFILGTNATFIKNSAMSQNTYSIDNIHISGSSLSAGAINNNGMFSVFHVGDNARFVSNESTSTNDSFSPSISAGAIYNSAKFHLGNKASFTDNISTSVSNDTSIRSIYTATASISAGAIYNSAKFHLGNKASFTDNISISTSTSTSNGGSASNPIDPSKFISSSAGAIFNTDWAIFNLGDDASFANNTSSSTHDFFNATSSGAIYNGRIFYLGNGARFVSNESSSSADFFSSESSGAIYNSGTFHLGNDARFVSNESTSSTMMGKAIVSGAIYNSGTFYLGDNARFTDNVSNVFSPTIKSSGAIYNSGIFYLGKNASFSGNSSRYVGKPAAGVIYNSGTFHLDTGGDGDRTIFTGNLATGVSNSIYMFGGIFNVTGNGTLDMLDPFSSSAVSSTSNKTGNSTWKLGGISDGAGKLTLNISEGKLYLYSEGEVSNGNVHNWSAIVAAGKITNIANMTVGTADNGATLIANGGNELTGTNLTIHSGSTFGFKANASNMVDLLNPSASNAVMSWGFNNIKHDGDGIYTINVLEVTSGVGQYHLLNSTSHHGFDLNNLILNIPSNGQIIGRLKDIFELDSNLFDIYLTYSQEIQNALAIWNNTAQVAVWDSSESNWDIDVSNHKTSKEKFLDKDQVVFGKNSHQQTIEITNNVIVGDMTVDGGNYKFTGQGITTDKTGVGLSNSTEQLMLTNGAKVDFTGITGNNHFANGIDLNDGALTVSNQDQLGTDLAGVQFGTQGTLNLDIAKSDTFDAGTLSSTTGTVNKFGAGTWQLNGTNSIDTLSLEEGTLALGQNTSVQAQTMNIGSVNKDSRVSIQDNILSGDILQLTSGGAQGSTTFGINIQSDNFVDSKNNSIAAMQWNFNNINNDGGKYAFDISPVTSGVGQYHLLNSSSHHGFDLNNLILNIQGNGQIIGRLKDIFELDGNLFDIYLTYSQETQNAIATWKNTAQTAIWDSNANTWDIDVAHQTIANDKFLDKDQVIFGQNNQQQIIDIVSNVIVGDMTINGGDYKFTGAGITTNGSGVGLLQSVSEKLMINSDATVDFTGITGMNTFNKGIDLDGALTVSNQAQLGTDLAGVQFGTQGTLNLDIAKSDSFDAGTLSSQQGTVNKSGAGTWRLNGVNSIGTLSLKEGTLALGQNTSIQAQTMNMGSINQHSRVLTQSGNKLSGDTLNLHSGDTQGSTTFGVTVTADNRKGNNTAAMQWGFVNINHDGGQYTFDITSPISIGEYHLLSSNKHHGFTQNQLTLTYLGFKPSVVNRLKDVFELKVDVKDIYVEYKKVIQNGIATWVNTATMAAWNIADQNWDVAIVDQTASEKTFLVRDQVIFGANAQQQTIAITENVTVSDMTVVGGDYKFTGEGITTDGSGAGLSNSTEQLSIQNGAKVDFTGITGTNHFANGIDLNDGALTVSKANQLGTDLSHVNFGMQGTLNLDIAKLDIFDAGSLANQQGTVNKLGAGTWQLNGVNSIGTLSLKEGTLALGQNTEINATTMTLGSVNQHSQLIVDSSSQLSGGTLNLNSGDAQGSTAFGIKLGTDNYVTKTHQGAAVMNWTFSSIMNDGGQYIWDVETVPSGYGKYYLLNSNVAHNFNQSQFTLKYAGYDHNSIERIKDSFKFIVDSNNIYLDYNQISPNGIATWNNTDNQATWNVGSQNWNVAITSQIGLGKTFLNQDHVMFGSQVTSPQTINIIRGVTVAGMDVTSGDYNFTGQGISTANTGVGLLNSTEQLSIQNGAKVDFTGITGTNHFANGIDLDDGTLTVSKKAQLGTDLSSVNFGTQGTLNLDITKTDIFDAGTLSSVQGTVNKSGTGTWLLNGANSVDALNLQSGTLKLVNNATVQANTMNIGSADQHSQVAMDSSNQLSGGTLNLNSGGANGSTTFGITIQADNFVNAANTSIAAMQWNFNSITNDGGQYTFDISSLTSGVGQYHLLNSNIDHSFNQSQLTLKYAGYDPNAVERIKDTFEFIVDLKDIYLDYKKVIHNGIATWVNTDSTAIWNVADQNWNVSIMGQPNLEQTFLNRDQVIFGDLGLSAQTINVNASSSTFDINGMMVDSATDYTFNGDGLVLMANTELTKKGTGILAFNNEVTGNVSLQGGSLIIGDASTNNIAKLTGDVIAQSGTTVGGHGTIAGIATLHNGATLSPGNSIGALTVGELNLQDGSKVILDTAPNGDSDKIIAKKLATTTGITTGSITIGQNVVLDIVAGAGQWSPSTNYNFMTAEGMIAGAFSGVTTNLAFLNPHLVTGTNGAPELVMNRNDIVLGSVAATYNQRSTANAINTLSHGNTIYDAVVSMSADQARLAYDNLSGELYASTENALFQNANRLNDSMLNRIYESSTGLWINGWGYDGEIKDDGNAAKVENKGSGLLLGYDWNLKDNILVGAAIGQEESKIKIKEHNRKGKNTVKSTHFMVYGNVDLDVAELKTGLNYSQLRFKANRYINIPTLAGNANAKYHGHQVHAFIELSKKFNITDNYDVSPYMNLAYTEIKAKSFTETGSKAALSSKGQSNSRTAMTLGIQNDWYVGTDKNLAITADIGWKHTFGNETIDKRFNFVGSDQNFNIKSASINKNSAVVGLGIKGQHKEFTIDVGYQGEFNSKVKDHALSAKLKWSF